MSDNKPDAGMTHYRVTETTPYAFDLVRTVEVYAHDEDEAIAIMDEMWEGIYAVIEKRYPSARFTNIEQNSDMGADTHVEVIP